MTLEEFAAKHCKNGHDPAQCEKLRDLQELVVPLEAKVARLRRALEKIAAMGKVCDEFEACQHQTCADSAGAALVAMDALKE